MRVRPELTILTIDKNLFTFYMKKIFHTDKFMKIFLHFIAKKLKASLSFKKGVIYRRR